MVNSGLSGGLYIYVYIIYIYLVGGAITILKNMKVNWDHDIPKYMENKKCSKPPARLSNQIGKLMVNHVGKTNG